jgi:hypothetical protein
MTSYEPAEEVWMGEAKRRKEMGLPTQTVRFPALTMDEVRLIHDMMHHRLHELAAEAEQADEAGKQRYEALRELHHKLFAH